MLFYIKKVKSLNTSNDDKLHNKLMSLFKNDRKWITKNKQIRKKYLYRFNTYTSRISTTHKTVALLGKIISKQHA